MYGDEYVLCDSEDKMRSRSVLGIFMDLKKTKLNSVALVRKRPIPTERPQLVGEVKANFCG
jgi:hypothetical protein